MNTLSALLLASVLASPTYSLAPSWTCVASGVDSNGVATSVSGTAEPSEDAARVNALGICQNYGLRFCEVSRCSRK